MFDGEWYGSGAAAVAMSRSSSAASFLGDREDDLHYRMAFGEGKRPFGHFANDHLPDDYECVHPPKRPQYAGIVINRHREPPPFFVLREGGRPAGATFVTSEHDHDYDHGYEEADLLSRPASAPLDRPSAHAPVQVQVQEVIGHRFLDGANLRPHPVERTSSGLSIAPDEDDYESSPGNSDTWEDELAAGKVEKHFVQYHRRTRDSKAERILKSLISPRSSPGKEFEIDNAALQSIFHAANEIFFYGCLKGRVRWDWSDSSNKRYHSQIIGTTALREADDGGYETLIVLSHHYLKDKRYNRRLLISTFLHELTHSYLFVRCGFKARRSGGHTEGFHRIAKLMDKWAGPDTLFLSNMEADLDDFRLLGNESCDSGDGYHHYGMQCRQDAAGFRSAMR